MQQFIIDTILVNCWLQMSVKIFKKNVKEWLLKTPLVLLNGEMKEAKPGGRKSLYLPYS